MSKNIVWGTVIVIVSLAVISAAMAAKANAANWQDSRLDSVASIVAGHSVSVYCEDSRAEWVDIERAMGNSGDDLGGFTWLPGAADPFGNYNTVYIQPESCDALHVFGYNWGTNGGAMDAGMYWFAQAVAILTHESVHQRGIADEGLTECTSYHLLPQVYVNQFNIKRTVSVKTVAKVRGKFRTVYKRVANPILARLLVWNKAIHNTMPAEYRTYC
jgi:hypothetical protein